MPRATPRRLLRRTSRLSQGSGESFPERMREREGVEHREARTTSRLRPCGLRRAAPFVLKAGASPSDAPPRRFLVPWPRFRAEQTDAPHAAPPVPEAAPAASFVSAASSPLSGQPVVMPAGGWAGPPERGVTSPARGRRHPPHVRQCPAERPSRGVDVPRITGVVWKSPDGAEFLPVLAYAAGRVNSP